MIASKLLERALRLYSEYACANWYEQLHMSVPPPPYYERLHPLSDYQRQPYWLRIRSNPTRRNYH